MTITHYNRCNYNIHLGGFLDPHWDENTICGWVEVTGWYNNTQPVVVHRILKYNKNWLLTQIIYTQGCKRHLTHPTIVYMLHCAQSMYNNLLWANWNKTSLSHVILIGNKLSSYHERLVFIHIRRLLLLLLLLIETQANNLRRDLTTYIKYPCHWSLTLRILNLSMPLICAGRCLLLTHMRIMWYSTTQLYMCFHDNN